MQDGGQSQEEDSHPVAEDLGVHQLSRLVELLAPRECEKLLSALSHPEDSILRQLERLSPESNNLELPSRVRREADRETQCRTALTVWLLRHGQQVYYDRLSRALQLIGRTDIAIDVVDFIHSEVGKNINQDKALSLQKYVEDYHRRVNAMESSLFQPEMEPVQPAMRRARDLTWRDLELVIEREQRPPYSRRLVDRVLPLVYGLLLGFLGALLVGSLVFSFSVRVSQADGARPVKLPCKTHNKARRQPRASSGYSSSDMTSSENGTASSDTTPLHLP